MVQATSGYELSSYNTQQLINEATKIEGSIFEDNTQNIPIFQIERLHLSAQKLYLNSNINVTFRLIIQ